MTARRTRRERRRCSPRVVMRARSRLRGGPRGKARHRGGLARGIAGRGLARARSRGHAVLELPRGRVVIELATRVAPQHVGQHQARWRARITSMASPSSACRTTTSCSGTMRVTAVPLPAGVRTVGGVHRRCERRCALRALAGPRSLCAGSRIPGRISGRPRSAHAHGVARALLRHGRRRPRRSRGEHRRRDVCGDRQCAPAARPQCRAGRAGPQGHGAPLDACRAAAARWVSMSPRNPRCRSARCGSPPTCRRPSARRSRCCAPTAPRSAPYSSNGASGTSRGSSTTQERSTSATCRCRYARPGRTLSPGSGTPDPVAEPARDYLNL